MNIQHLNELIRVLENVNPIDFNLAEWVVDQKDLQIAIANEWDISDRKYQQLQDQNNCGTVCCAMGWACQDQYFIENGLTLGGAAQTPTHLSTIYNKNTGKSEKQPTRGFKAIKDFFGFENIKTGENLFLDRAYETQDKTTPEQVIARVRDLIEIGEDKFLEHYEGHITTKLL